ncbi:hypothetical protein LTR70_000426 [Exophiala xenobiotica]|uniref:RRM domain-containing protein n=1 Tax=Lithohypha guttulata TaxID=1690604 RepID=A0ABR0KPS4_9EURO|nr:hypothetical protein LTR24_000127 [Lithohypha guttulata]KAK5330596.1 hypothetical protein LTR70_000426 [Exophiala xenobiotica]
MEKRKRSADAQEDGARAAKKQATEKASGASAAERRQLRSERKSKKGHQAKENARKKRPQTTDEPELFLPGQNGATGTDNIADGQDFVPLGHSTDAAPTPQLNGGATEGAKAHGKRKEKRPSPRSERKTGTGAKAVEEEPGAEEETTEEPKKSKDAPRFICFVGNLPYTCTTEQIQQHFRKLEPTSIRHSTDKATRKSKGFAFLEFDDYSKMKTCLKVYHHSIFDPERTSRLPDDAFDENGLEKDVPGQYKKQTGRKINVELTAGGGGKGAERKEKIQKKNTKLFEERERRKQAEGKQQKGKDKPARYEKSEANSTEIGSEAVHPSRLRRYSNRKCMEMAEIEAAVNPTDDDFRWMEDELDLDDD